MKKIALLAVLAVSATGACASDIRHLRHASTPTEASQPGPGEATTRADRQAPYALTGPRRSGSARPAPPNLQTWVVGNPQFRPGK
jgi:hypothetical protein